VKVPVPVYCAKIGKEKMAKIKNSAIFLKLE